MAYVYHAPILTVDGVIFQIIDGSLNVLLVKRAAEPFKGHWALPGGYNAAGDTTLQAMYRVLTTKVGITPEDLTHTEQLYTFDTVGRDPRGHTVSVTYMGLGRNLNPQASFGVWQPTFFPVSKLPKLAYDHESIIKYGHERLVSRTSYSSAVFALLPVSFTLTQLQSVYEAILGRPLDRRNFRKKFLSFDLLKPTDKFYTQGAHRPAALYRFKKQSPQPLVRSFD